MKRIRKQDFLRTMDQSAEMLTVDQTTIDKERDGIDQAKNHLGNLHKLMDESLADELDFLKELESQLSNPRQTDHGNLLVKKEKIIQRPQAEEVFLSLIETQKISYNWQEAQALNRDYAKAQGIDIDAPFLKMFNGLEKLEVAEQLVEKLDLLKLDKMDYGFAAAAGLIAGIIDVILVGTIKKGDKAEGLQKKMDQMFEKIVNEYGKKVRISELNEQLARAKSEKARENIKREIKKVKEGIVSYKKDGEIITRPWTVKDSIKWLEIKYPVSYDAAVNPKSGEFHIKGMTADNHHLFSLAHDPGIMGLLVGILDQITGKSTFIDAEGRIQRVVTQNINRQLSDNPLLKIAEATKNWFGHVMSDISGSKDSQGRGSGLPVPGWALLQKLQFGSIRYDDQRPDITVAELSDLMFKNGYDLRAFSAQLIPVMIYETLVRCYWFYKQYFYYGRDLKKSLPIANSRELSRLILVSAATFSAIDAAHATIEYGSQRDVLSLVMTINVPGLINLGFRALQNVRNEIHHRKHVAKVFEEDILIEYERVMRDSSVF